MAWSIAGIIIHPDSEQDKETIEAHYALQDVVDAVVTSISFFGSGSPRRSLEFVLDENENGGAGRSTLKTALESDAQVNLTSDQGSQGDFRLLSLQLTRRQAVNKVLPVYNCSCEMIAS